MHMRLGTRSLSQTGVVLFQAKFGEARRRECQNKGGGFVLFSFQALRDFCAVLVGKMRVFSREL